MAGKRGVRQDGQARAAILAGSVALHLAVLAALGVIASRPAFRIPSDPPPLELRLVETRKPPRVLASSSKLEGGPSSVRVRPSTPSPDVVSPTPSSITQTSSPAADNGAVHLYDANPKACAKEDLALLSPVERLHCASTGQRMGELPQHAIPTDGPNLDGLDPRKRGAWDAEMASEAARRDGSAGQGALAAIKAARGPYKGPSDKIDINAGFNCKMAFGIGGVGPLKCGVGPPAPALPQPR